MEQRRWKVLIADDDPAICMLIDTVLRKGPYEITACADAESAILVIDRDGPFDLMICDFMLPGATGLDLIERVRSSESSAAIPILMISGHTSTVMERAKSAGANCFLNKPFTISQLRNAVASLLADPAHFTAS